VERRCISAEMGLTSVSTRHACQTGEAFRAQAVTRGSGNTSSCRRKPDIANPMHGSKQTDGHNSSLDDSQSSQGRQLSKHHTNQPDAATIQELHARFHPTHLSTAGQTCCNFQPIITRTKAVNKQPHSPPQYPGVYLSPIGKWGVIKPPSKTPTRKQGQ
jgi:hypothetical protein